MKIPVKEQNNILTKGEALSIWHQLLVATALDHLLGNM
jgi:hypothetical protein